MRSGLRNPLGVTLASVASCRDWKTAQTLEAHPTRDTPLRGLTAEAQTEGDRRGRGKDKDGWGGSGGLPSPNTNADHLHIPSSLSTGCSKLTGVIELWVTVGHCGWEEEELN